MNAQGLSTKLLVLQDVSSILDFGLNEKFKESRERVDWRQINRDFLWEVTKNIINGQSIKLFVRLALETLATSHNENYLYNFLDPNQYFNFLFSVFHDLKSELFKCKIKLIRGTYIRSKSTYTPGWFVWGECLFYEVNDPLLQVCYKP